MPFLRNPKRIFSNGKGLLLNKHTAVISFVRPFLGINRSLSTEVFASDSLEEMPRSRQRRRYIS
jgi:hypothetical protein